MSFIVPLVVVILFSQQRLILFSKMVTGFLAIPLAMRDHVQEKLFSTPALLGKALMLSLFFYCNHNVFAGFLKKLRDA